MPAAGLREGRDMPDAVHGFLLGWLCAEGIVHPTEDEFDATVSALNHFLACAAGRTQRNSAAPADQTFFASMNSCYIGTPPRRAAIPRQ